MTRFTANSAFMRQIRASHERRVRQVQADDERLRILKARIARAGASPDDPDAPLIAARFLFQDTCLRNVHLSLIDDRLWLGEGDLTLGVKHQAGFGIQALEACVKAWNGDHQWNEAHPDASVVISVRDWLEPVERWSWDVRRTGSVPVGQPSFW